MTLKQLFRRARRGRTWIIDNRYQIRCHDGKCPLGAVEDQLVNVPQIEMAARAIGIRVSLARKIAHAADRRYSPDRAWLMKNLGMGV